MDFEHILYDITDNVATITLNRPERYNALNGKVRQNLLNAVLHSNENDDVRAVIITGAGKAFCSGGDMKALNDPKQREKMNPSSDKISPIRDQIILAMRGAAKPYIAAINGPAAGGGLGIAFACDIRLAADTARVGLTFSRRGLHPDWGGTYFLPMLVGTAKAAELIWSGRMIEAQEAVDMGIVSELTKPENLLPRAIEMAMSFAAGPPIAIRLSKRAIYRNMEPGLREALEFETYAQNICVETDDVKEGVAAFVEKREPKFRGK